MGGKASRESRDCVVIGGGFFGCSIALHAARAGSKVTLLEKENGLLQRASYANQARIHNGYHYPRSYLTALRSRANYSRFLNEFKDCVDSSFKHYYAVASRFSLVTAKQFEAFCRRIGAALEPAPREVGALFDKSMVEEVFQVEECAFDAVKLRRKMTSLLGEAGVDVRLGARVVKVASGPGSGLEVAYEAGGGTARAAAPRVYNCAYSQLNRVLALSGLPAIDLDYELAEIALVEAPPALKAAGITVVCGPFFSLMPFPPRGLHSLSHVRYTPHCSWKDSGGSARDGDSVLKEAGRRSHFDAMLQDAARYCPVLKGCRYRESLWEVKALLPLSRADDSRPILLHKESGIPGLTNVLGGKIDNVFDILDAIDRPQAGRGS